MFCGKSFSKGIVILCVLLLTFSDSFSQRYLSGLDTTLFVRDSLRPLLKRFENISITGYMQPQFQVAQKEGISSYAGRDFSPFSRSRFMLRRARVKVDYVLPTKNHFPAAWFSFQIDATERGVIVRDMFLRLYETSKKNLSLMAGFFARPFGFEVNLSSSFRETPERGRMSQILMPGERDLGMAIVFEPLDTASKLKKFRWDAGFFNGQGQQGPTDFDSYKDFISRITFKPMKLGKNEISGGLSLLLGGWQNGTKYVYESGLNTSGQKIFVIDSSESNLGTSSPRHYYGADIQYQIPHSWGETELRAEYWFGTQPGSSTTTVNPGTLPAASGIPLPTYVRHFDGAFFYFLQNIINPRHQLLLKYDWYDPNIKVSNKEIGTTGTNLTVADIKHSTLGVGYVFNFNPKTKLILYYDIVRNEETNMAGYKSDIKDNVFTSRLQFRF